MLVLLAAVVRGAYAVDYTTLKVGDVLHVGDAINSTTEYSIHDRVTLDPNSGPWTLVRADINLQGAVESATGTYYTFKDNSGKIIGFKDKHDGVVIGAYPVTATTNGIFVTSISGNSVTFTVIKGIVTPVQKIDFSNDAKNAIPLGWTLFNDINDGNPDGETRPSGSSQGSGPRLFHFETGDYQNVFYVRSTESADKHGKTVATYGNIEEYRAILPVAMLRIDFLASGYMAAGQKILCEVLDATDQTVLASLEATTTVVTPNGGPAAQEKFTIAYDNAEERNAILRYTVFGDGTKETILSAIIINTYEEITGTCYFVALKNGTEDADEWSIYPNPTDEGETVTVYYTGTKKVKSVKGNNDIDLTSTDGGVTWTFPDGMPAFDVELEIEYYNDVNLTAKAGDAADEYWATYYDSSVGYTADDNTTVYQAAVNGTKTGVVLTEVTGREIPAGKAVVLKSSASSITLTPATTTQTLTGNELKGSDVDLSTPSNAYCLSKETTGSSPRGIGFYTYTLSTIPAHKAYLVVAGGPSTSRGFLGFGGDDNTTGISLPEAVVIENDGPIYDLSGRRIIGQSQKGVYVKNGKKFVIK